MVGFLPSNQSELYIKNEKRTSMNFEPDSPMTEANEIQVDELALLPEEEDDLTFPAPVPTQVVYSGQDFDIHGLVRRLDQGDIVVPQFGIRDQILETANFQRGFVWNRPQMDRFIESLLLGFPIPGIFLVKQTDGRLLVLDGQQRLRTLQHFYSGFFNERTYKLRNVADEFVDLSYDMLSDSQRRALDNSFIQATIVTARPEAGNMEAVYQIFERLNSGGTQLTAHEIRVALFAGPMIDFLEELNVSEDWRSLFGRKNQRIRDQELVARILAFYLDWESYSRPLKGFLNGLLNRNRREVAQDTRSAGELFLEASTILNRLIGAPALRRASRQVNNAWTDALYVGLMKRLADAPISDSAVREAYQKLRADTEYQNWVTGSSADEEQVLGRMKFSIESFAQA